MCVRLCSSVCARIRVLCAPFSHSFHLLAQVNPAYSPCKTAWCCWSKVCVTHPHQHVGSCAFPCVIALFAPLCVDAVRAVKARDGLRMIATPAWEKIAKAVNRVSTSGTEFTPNQCRARFSALWHNRHDGPGCLSLNGVSVRDCERVRLVLQAMVEDDKVRVCVMYVCVPESVCVSLSLPLAVFVNSICVSVVCNVEGGGE